MDTSRTEGVDAEESPPIDSAVVVRDRVAAQRRGRRRPDDPPTRQRGQTTLDFAIGVGVFLIVVAFVVSFVPAVLQPFNSGQEEAVTADRVASTLTGGMLGSPESPYHFDTSCTVAFFGGAMSDDGCEFDAGDSLEDRLGLGPRATINVRLVGDVDADGNDDGTETLCWDNPDDPPPQEGRIVEEDNDNGECDVAFSIGAGSPGEQSVNTARRAVTIDGTNAMLEVRSW